MGKVPVLGTVSRAYGFLLGEFATILRLAWAPLLIGAAFSYFYGGQAIDATIAADANADPARALEFAPIQLLIGIVGFVTGIMASVALLRVVIFGDRKPGLFVYLWLGGTELRLILVTILLFIAIVAGGVALTLVLAVLAALTVALPVMGIVLLIASFALFFIVIWAALRLTLISPVVVAENNLGVERSWAITRGNALRILAVLLLTFVPYLLVASLLFFAVMGNDMPAFPALPAVGPKDAAGSKEAAEAFAKTVELWQFGVMKAMRAHWVEFSVLGFAGNLITAALSAGALGSAYTAIVGEPRD